MKIAVYIVGQWRGCSYQCSENLKKIFDKFDTDYYIHIWPLYEGKNINLSQYNIESNPIVEHKNYIHTESDFERIKNTYNNVVSFQIESYDSIKEIKSIHSTFYQYYCAYRANEVRKEYEKQNGIVYDAIIKIRPDIIFNDLDIECFIKRIEYIQSNPSAIFSFYVTQQMDLKPNTYLFWDFYTISNPFGMNCMVQWIEDVIKTNNIQEIFSSNYVMNDSLIINPIISNTDVPSPQLMRECFKYNNLIEDFYNQMNLCRNNPNDENFILNSINDYLYNFNIKDNSIVEYFKKMIVENVKREYYPRGLHSGWSCFLNETQLKQLADLIKDRLKGI